MNISYSKTIECSSLSLEFVDDVESSGSFSPSVFSISDWVSDHGLQKGLQNCPRVVVTERRYFLHSPLLAKRRIAGFVIPSIVFFVFFLECLLALTLPYPFTPFPAIYLLHSKILIMSSTFIFHFDWLNIIHFRNNQGGFFKILS